MVWIVACSRGAEDNVVTETRGANPESGESTLNKEVKCGAVYITDEDRTKKVTKNVVSLSAGPEDTKKKSSSKYTLAIGSSFGHIHTFLKDSEPVLKNYEKTQAEDKCLLLIKKPKSASKQMLKAHSWTNLSAGPDAQQRRWDGHPSHEHMVKKTPPNLSLPPEDSQLQSSNHRDHYKPHSANQNSSFKSLSSVNENEAQDSNYSDMRKTKHEQISNKIASQATHNKHISKSSQNLLFPQQLSNPQDTAHAIERQKSVSSVDLRQVGKEINNNKMGGVLGNNRAKPKRPPPKVPDQRGNAKQSDPRINGEHILDSQSFKSNQVHRQNSDSKLSLRDSGGFTDQPDLIPTGHHSLGSHNSQSKRLNVSANSSDDSSGFHRNYVRMKHDSGFISDLPLSSDEQYNSGFKKELSTSKQNGINVTSSPKTSTRKNANNQSPSNSSQSNRPVAGNHGNQPNANSARYANDARGTEKQRFQSNGVFDKIIQSNDRRHVKSMDNMHSGTQKHGYFNENMVRSQMHLNQQGNHPQADSRPVQRNHSDKQNNQNLDRGQSPNSGYAKSDSHAHHGNHRHHHQGNHFHGNQGQGPRPRSSEQPGQRSNIDPRDVKHRKSLANVAEEPKFNLENKHPVIKTKSMGDLSEGCAFSLVGQKKAEMIPSSIQSQQNGTEFTGTQMMKHIRKYRELSQKDNGTGSLPFKGTAVDDMDTTVYNRGRNIPEPQVPSSNTNVNSRPLHYGSLQYLPASSVDESPQNVPNQTQIMAPPRRREQTPMKPRRSLPQTPGDLQEKKKQMSDIVKTRVSAGSRCSTTSPGSNNSNRGSSTEMRQGGISATPSDREVCVLLQGNRPPSNSGWKVPQQPSTMCNNNSNSAGSEQTNRINRGQVPPGYYHPSTQKNMSTNGSRDSSHLRKSGSFGSNDQGTLPPSSTGRLSESGQTTLTSQSTIDSGYVTTDPDQETLSTTTYAKSLQQSAQNLFKRHSQKSEKPAQPPPYSQIKNQHKGDHQSQTVPKGSNSNERRQKVKDSHAHTQSWLENHPGTVMNDNYKMIVESESGNVQYPKSTDATNRDTNNNKPRQEDSVSELDLIQNEMQKKYMQNGQHRKHSSLSHHLSELSARDLERLNSENGQFRSKGKSISMSQGLNLIASKTAQHPDENMLTKNQPKFTGSLKDLIGVDKQIVPIETLKLEKAPSMNTLPGNWKFQGPTRPESSLKLFGKPSLFQLLQNYNLFAVRLRVPENFVITENLRMIDCEVVLSSPWIYGKDSASLLSPKGSYAKLGGPNSAFKPVVSGSVSSIRSVSMVTIMEMTNEIAALIEPGQLLKGDLIVEVNERLMMGEDLPTLVTMLQGCHGELLLTIARDKARVQQASEPNMPADADFRHMEQKIQELTTELQKKDRTLKQLNELFPWKRNAVKGGHSDQDGYLCSLSDDEFIV